MLTTLLTGSTSSNTDLTSSSYSLSVTALTDSATLTIDTNASSIVNAQSTTASLLQASSTVVPASSQTAQSRVSITYINQEPLTTYGELSEIVIVPVTQALTRIQHSSVQLIGTSTNSNLPRTGTNADANASTTFIIIGAAGGGGLLFLAVCYCLVKRRTKKPLRIATDVEQPNQTEMASPSIYSQTATSTGGSTAMQTVIAN